MEQKAASSELKAKDESNKNELHKEAQDRRSGAVCDAGSKGRLLVRCDANRGSHLPEPLPSESRVKANSPRWTISAGWQPAALFRFRQKLADDSGCEQRRFPRAGRQRFRYLGGRRGRRALPFFRCRPTLDPSHPAADGQSLTADIVTLEFSDPQHGKLTTSNHETWITSDAGETWQRH